MSCFHMFFLALELFYILKNREMTHILAASANKGVPLYKKQCCYTVLQNNGGQVTGLQHVLFFLQVVGNRRYI